MIIQRKIGILTTSRAEYGILRPVLAAIQAEPALSLRLFVGGAHLSAEFGHTVDQIEYPISARIESLLSSDTPEGISKSMGMMTMAFSQVLAEQPPDVLLITGDRYEAAAAALAAVPFKIPIAHLGGGDTTTGAFDESLRHMITKLSHLHFCYGPTQARRVMQMGENPHHVWVTGNPAIDALQDYSGIPPATNAIVVIFHPVTLEYEKTAMYIGNLLEALRRIQAEMTEPKHPIVFILPNADTAGRTIIKAMRRFPGGQAHANLVPQTFYNLLAHAACIVGNSSAALMEAPTFEVPAVNIGTRQEGRLQGDNVINCGYEVDAIVGAIRKALGPEFSSMPRKFIWTENPYGDGHATPRIVRALLETDLTGIIEKEFNSFVPPELFTYDKEPE
jgi:UDP-N-acetylglucosamine 2-epimerase (non-hydrolysing)